MLRIGVCDDEQNAREALNFALEKIIDEEKEEIVYDFSSGNSVVRWLKAHPGEIDLLFLDVEMDGINGMEVARQIRDFNPDLILVFVTGYMDYVFDGYQVQALDYVIKPAQEARLREVLDRANAQLLKSEEEQYTFQNADGIYRLYHRDILYCYSDRRIVTIVTKSNSLTLYTKLDQLQIQLGNGFIRIHQRYLVNIDAVTRIHGDTVYIQDTALPMSRSLKAAAMTALAKAMLGGMNS